MVVVDPGFGRRMRELRGDLPYRALARLTNYSHTYLWEIETGRKPPTVDAAGRIDDALGTGGALARLVTDYELPLDGDQQDRLRVVRAQPRRLDAATVDSLATLLHHQRRLEDVAGSATLLAPVTAQLAVIETLVGEAPDDGVRAATVRVGAQWAQFAGWLSGTTGDVAQGRAWYVRAMEWASEVGDADMIATALNMRGHLAWTCGQVRSLLALSEAAAWQPAALAVRATAVQQQARAYALLGDGPACDSRFDEAEDLSRRAAERPDELPPWLYFYDPDFLLLQRGLAQHYLGCHELAVDLLAAGLDRLPAEYRRSDWIGWYVLQLAAAHADAGDPDSAVDRLGEAQRIADSTGARRLAGDVDRLARRLVR